MCVPWLRWKAPNLERPIKVNLIWPILYILATAFVTIVPMIASPVETGIGLLMILTAIPVYGVFILWKDKPKWFVKGTADITCLLQKVFVVIGKGKAAEL